MDSAYRAVSSRRGLWSVFKSSLALSFSVFMSAPLKSLPRLPALYRADDRLKLGQRKEAPGRPRHAGAGGVFGPRGGA